MTREEVMRAVREFPPSQDYVWDGVDEDDRPATPEELHAGLEEAQARRRPGRPMGTGIKEQVALRVDRDILAAFRATGPGWQTRMNDALRDWLKRHSPSDSGRR